MPESEATIAAREIWQLLNAAPVPTVEAELRAALDGEQAGLDLAPWLAAYGERSAVLEHDAGLPRDEADRRAGAAVLEGLRQHLRAEPPTAVPERPLFDAIEELFNATEVGSER